MKNELNSLQYQSIKERLYFIDALRAWAILMMLQGHFITALLADSARTNESTLYFIWAYLRGLTAPVFFTVSGFIFSYLLFKNFKLGWSNPRVKKGVKRGAILIVIGYVLQIEFVQVFEGSINPSFDIVHVLQCLGLSMLLIILLYLLVFRVRLYIFQLLLGFITVLLFMASATFEQWEYGFLPEVVSNYFTRRNGSVFTIVPWFGFATAGACLAGFFHTSLNKEVFYRNLLLILPITALILIFQSYEFIKDLGNLTNIDFFDIALQKSYLFARLGVVLLAFVPFVLLRNFWNHKILLDIGQNTLAIYVLHCIVLYGSISGFGLDRYYHHSLPFSHAIIGAITFMVLIGSIVLIAGKRIKRIKPKTITGFN